MYHFILRALGDELHSFIAFKKQIHVMAFTCINAEFLNSGL